MGVSRGVTNTVAKLSANALRRLAEKADGLRDKHPVLVVDENEKVDVVTEEEMRPNLTRLVELDTANDGPGLQFKPTIRLIVNGTEYGKDTELDQADAVFTSQSAVEKFLLPYYLHVRTPEEVSKMAREMFDDEFIISSHHLPGSSYGLDKIKKVKLNTTALTNKLQFIDLPLFGPRR